MVQDNHALAAHARLLRRLPVREHRIFDDKHDAQAAGAPKPILIGGKQYPSVKRARLALCLSYSTVYMMLEDGRARYL